MEQLREINEEILEKCVAKFELVMIDEIKSGSLPAEIVYACMTALCSTLDDGSASWANFVCEALNEVINASNVSGGH